MRIYSLRRESFLNAPITDVWKYFSNTDNLNDLTPADMSFEVLGNQNEIDMYASMIINYRIRPLLNIPLRWTTEITHCVAEEYFVDEQRFGPYAFWHHQHKFEQSGDGVLMTDIVHYAIGWGFIGRVANALYVSKRLKDIFDFRQEKISGIFGHS